MSPESLHLPETPENRPALVLAVTLSAIATSALLISVKSPEFISSAAETTGRLWGHVKHAGKKVVNALEDPTKHAGKRVVAGASGTKEALEDLKTVAWPVHPLRRLGNLAHNLADRLEVK